MRWRSCPHEKEVTQALRNGHWPHGCDQDLRSHVQQCLSCSDLALVTEIFQRAHTEAAQIPASRSAGLLWWRAQLRRRYAAEEQVGRPITVAQTFAWLVTVLVAIVFVASQHRHGLHWAWLWSELELPRVSSLWLLATKFDSNRLLLIPSLGVLVLLSGVVVYLVSEKQ